MPVLAPIAAFAGTSAGAATIGAAATIGGAAIAANGAKSAASTAANAQAQASAAQKALQDQAIATANKVNAPGLQTGYAALDALAARYGLGTTSTASQAQAAPASYDQYLNDPNNADLKAEAARVVGNDPRFPTLESYLQWHDANYAGEGRQSYTSGPSTGSPEAPNTSPVYSTSGPTIPDAPTYRTADSLGFGSAPAAPTLDAAAFEASPYYNLGLQAGLDATNAGWNARGLLKSGAAAKALSDYGQTNFKNNYGDWAGQQLDIWKTNLGQFNADRSAAYNQLNNENAAQRNIFESDRNYTTGRYDTETNDLFRLAGIGQTAAGNVTNAASGYASNVGNIYQNNANSASDQANTNAAAAAYLGNTVGGQIANLFNNGVKTSGGYAPVLTTSGNGWVNPGNIFQTAGYP